MSEEPTAQHPIIRSPTLASGDLKRWKAPWSSYQIAQLTAYQQGGYGHPYTCGTASSHPNLIPSRMGWHCSACDYRQDWAHSIIVRPLLDSIDSASPDAVAVVSDGEPYPVAPATDVMRVQIPKPEHARSHNDLCGLPVTFVLGSDTFKGLVFSARDRDTHYEVNATVKITGADHHTMMLPISTHKRRAEPKPTDNLFLIMVVIGMLLAALAAVAMVALSMAGIFDSSAELTRIP